LGFPVQDGPEALKVGHLAPFGDARDVQADAAFFFGLPAAGNFPGLFGAFPANVANLCHLSLLILDLEGGHYKRWISILTS
jgi:hypothetical protein